MAEPGDLIAVSGPLGGAAAGLRLLQEGIAGYPEVKRYHTTPRCSMDQLDRIVPIAKAMEDVSDGLASEVRNICMASGVGARLTRENIPLCNGICETAALLRDDPYDYALFGGEDFKLVYTVTPDHYHRIVGSVVGEITAGTDIVLDKEKLTRFGYDHFARNRINLKGRK
jgi:thiamine-monophosphate kinase